MPDHTGRRRKQPGLPLGRMAVVIVALVAIGLLISLPEPRRGAPVQPALVVGPTRVGPETATTPGSLLDGTPYTPRIFLDPTTSVGVAPTRDSLAVRLVRRGEGGTVTELRRLAASGQPQFDGFTASGDTVVWAESVAQQGNGARTTLWRSNWRTASKPVSVTGSTGEPTFTGSQFDLVVHAGRIYWAAGTGTTEVRSVPVAGGRVTTKRLTGEYTMTAWPWAVSETGGRGKPVLLSNYDAGATAQLATGTLETATCSPVWCRVGVLGDDALIRLDLVKPDGTGRRRIAGREATPTIVDVALLDRYVPLATDRGTDSTGLSVYDITTGQTALIAADVANVRGNGPMLWWSVGLGADLTWHSIDVRTLA